MKWVILGAIFLYFGYVIYRKVKNIKAGKFCDCCEDCCKKCAKKKEM